LGTAARIRNFRVRAGKSRAEIAQLLGLNEAWYEDLEQNDEELTATLTLFQAMQLASILGVRLDELLEEAPADGERIALVDLPELINAHAAREGISMEQFEEQVGWEVRDFLDSPVKTAAELPIAFLQAVAARLGINWLSVVPDDDAA